MIDAFSSDLITLENAAKELSITQATVARWRNAGLNTIRIGRRIYTTRSAINQFLNEPKKTQRIRKRFETISAAID